MNFAKFLRTPFFAEHLWWLLLFIEIVMRASKLNQKTLSRFEDIKKMQAAF